MYVFLSACQSFPSSDWSRHHDRRLERVTEAFPVVPVDTDGKGVMRATQVQAVEVGEVAGASVPPAPEVPAGWGGRGSARVVLRVGKFVSMVAAVYGIAKKTCGN